MIQIDMPMPKNCLDCPACNEYLMCAIPVNGRKWGENDVCEFGQGRPDWCPMKEREAVVRCKDCKHGKINIIDEFTTCYNVGSCLYGNTRKSNWWCADGVKKDD